LLGHLGMIARALTGRTTKRKTPVRGKSWSAPCKPRGKAKRKRRSWEQKKVHGKKEDRVVNRHAFECARKNGEKGNPSGRGKLNRFE